MEETAIRAKWMSDLPAALRNFYSKMNSPPSPELPVSAEVVLEAADAIANLQLQNHHLADQVLGTPLMRTDREMADSAILFAVEIIEHIWDSGVSEDQQEVLDAATHQGIIHWRGPTQAEIDDPDWWGHEFDITAADTDSVGEIAPEFKQAAERAKLARSGN